MYCRKLYETDHVRQVNLNLEVKVTAVEFCRLNRYDHNL